MEFLIDLWCFDIFLFVFPCWDFYNAVIIMRVGVTLAGLVVYVYIIQLFIVVVFVISFYCCGLFFHFECYTNVCINLFTWQYNYSSYNFLIGATLIRFCIACWEIVDLYASRTAKNTLAMWAECGEFLMVPVNSHNIIKMLFTGASRLQIEYPFYLPVNSLYHFFNYFVHIYFNF